MKRIFLGLSSLLFMASAYAASFDCSKAQSAIEKMICASNDLQVLDLKLYEAYSRAQRLSAKSDNVRAEQRRWLHQIRNTCTTNECLKNAYDARIADLESDIHYKECERIKQGSASTVGQGYCEGRLNLEAENSMRDLITILSSRYNKQSIEKFNKRQLEWRENVECDCGMKVGRIMGPGDSLSFLECKGG